MSKWWLIHTRDRVAQAVTEDAECPIGCLKVYTDDWRKALKEAEEEQQAFYREHGQNWYR